ncbi:MAG: HD domain-containing protein [Clostridiales bacterium]|jgi:tRNA nucleotidyltransferase (CCA-adding enzyme)|nr:HD domain-containing protein [Clostridiales bacterium]
MNIEVPETLKALAEISAFPVYVVGGHVRNLLAGLGSTDVDIAGPAVSSALGLPGRYRIDIVNYKLGTAVIRIGGDSYEYTPFRLEKYAPGGGHTPIVSVLTTDLFKDALRRDFTCNSVYYDIKKGELIDPVGGVADIEKQLVRARNPKLIFASDGLRVMRLVRIACQTGFKIEGETAKAAMEAAPLLKDISAERKREELNLILTADQKYGVKNAHYRGIKLLHKMGVFPYLIPKVDLMEGVAQNPAYHKYDVLEHTLQTVRFAPPHLRLAALLHDIGKPYALEKTGNMHGHELVSANIAAYTLGEHGLKYANKVIDDTVWLVRHHMLDMAGDMRETKLRLFAAQHFDRIDDLAALIKADRMGTGMYDLPPTLRLEAVKRALTDENAPLKVTDLKIDGSMLISEGIQAVKIGGILEELWRACVLEPRLNNEDWLLARIRRYAEEPDEPETDARDLAAEGA